MLQRLFLPEPELKTVNWLYTPLEQSTNTIGLIKEEISSIKSFFKGSEITVYYGLGALICFTHSEKVSIVFHNLVGASVGVKKQLIMNENLLYISLDDLIYSDASLLLTKCFFREKESIMGIQIIAKKETLKIFKLF